MRTSDRLDWLWAEKYIVCCRRPGKPAITARLYDVSYPDQMFVFDPRLRDGLAIATLELDNGTYLDVPYWTCHMVRQINVTPHY